MENMLTWGYKNEIWEVNSKGLAFSVPKPGEPKMSFFTLFCPTYIWLKDTTIWCGAGSRNTRPYLVVLRKCCA